MLNSSKRTKEKIKFSDNLTWEEVPKRLPQSPGIYIFRDLNEKILYIGKAKNLKKRVVSYKKVAVDFKTSKISEKVVYISYIIVRNEHEAFILESNLIKKHKPPFNVKLVDGKTYPMIEITGENFPILKKTRRTANKKSKYFGPYPAHSNFSLGLDALRSLFPLRTCNRKIKSDKPTKPCLDYYIGLCSAPCSRNITQEEYKKYVDLLIIFLKGKAKEILNDYGQKMKKYGFEEKYELAAIYRDKIEALSNLFKKYTILYPKSDDFDIFAFYSHESYLGVEKQNVRDGKLINDATYIYKNPQENKVEMSQIIFDFYKTYKEDVPPKIVVSEKFENYKELEKALQVMISKKIKFVFPEKGLLKEGINTGLLNIKEKLKKFLEKEEEKESLLRIKLALSLKKMPIVVEGYDISNISGKDAVGSMVVFVNGKPSKKDYRYFKIKQKKSPDDTYMLKEVLERRFKKIDDVDFASSPDLIIVDGGKGQLNAVKSIKDKFNIDIDLISIAKEEELVFKEENPNPFKFEKNSDVLKFIQKVRDESHRFANKNFNLIHKKSVLEKVRKK